MLVCFFSALLYNNFTPWPNIETEFLLVHDAVLPFQVPDAWHVLLADPPKVYPGLQLNVTTLWYVTPLPDFTPLLGALKEPQLTTETKGSNEHTQEHQKYALKLFRCVFIHLWLFFSSHQTYVITASSTTHKDIVICWLLQRRAVYFLINTGHINYFLCYSFH